MYSELFFMPRLFLALLAHDSTRFWICGRRERRTARPARQAAPPQDRVSSAGVTQAPDPAATRGAHVLAAPLRHELQDHERLLVVAAADDVQNAAHLQDGWRQRMQHKELSAQRPQPLRPRAELRRAHSLRVAAAGRGGAHFVDRALDAAQRRRRLRLGRGLLRAARRA